MHIPCVRTSRLERIGDKWLYCADWVEHVLATGCEPYLKTPDDELSFLVRNSLDVYATLIICCLVPAWLALQGIRLLGTCVKGFHSTDHGSVLDKEHHRKKRE